MVGIVHRQEMRGCSGGPRYHSPWACRNSSFSDSAPVALRVGPSRLAAHRAIGEGGGIDWMGADPGQLDHERHRNLSIPCKYLK